jgi:hypothetical protein
MLTITQALRPAVLRNRGSRRQPVHIAPAAVVYSPI